MRKFIIRICLVLSMITFVSLVSNAQNTYVNRWVMGSGGNVGVAAPDGSKIYSVVGQTAISILNSSGTQVLHQGFWVNGIDTVLDVEDNTISLSDRLINFPNPFSNFTTIRYILPGTGHVTIKIFDIVGNLRRTLINDIQNLGQQEIIWDGKDDNGFDCSSGSYMYELNVAAYSASGNGQFSDFNLRNVMVIVR